jgi:hypothetical protein
MVKQSLIYESVTATLIDIHPTWEEPGQHVVRVTPEVSHTTIVREIPTRSKSVPWSRDEVLAPSNTRPGHHPGLPHSPSSKPPQSRGAV